MANNHLNRQFSGHGDVERFARHIAYVATNHGPVHLTRPKHLNGGSLGFMELRLSVSTPEGKVEPAGRYRVVCERNCAPCKSTGAKSTYECGFVDGVRDAIQELAPEVKAHMAGERSYNFTV